MHLPQVNKRLFFIILLLILFPIVAFGIYYNIYLRPSVFRITSQDKNSNSGRTIIYDSVLKDVFSGKSGVRGGREYRVVKFLKWENATGSKDRYIRVYNVDTKNEMVYRVIFDFGKQISDYLEFPRTNLSVEDLSVVERSGIGDYVARIDSFDKLGDKIDKIIKPGDILIIVDNPSYKPVKDKENVEVARWIIVRRFGGASNIYAN